MTVPFGASWDFQAGRTAGCALSVGVNPARVWARSSRAIVWRPSMGQDFQRRGARRPVQLPVPTPKFAQGLGLSAACAVQALSENASPVGEILLG